jgi:hypothetical protein
METQTQTQKTQTHLPVTPGKAKSPPSDAVANTTASLVSALQIKATIPDNVLLLTIVMGSAFIGDVFPQHVADVLKNNKLAQHATAIALLIVTIVWVRADMSAANIAFTTLITYVWYMSLLSSTPLEFALVIGMLLIVFVSSHVRIAHAKTAALAHALATPHHTHETIQSTDDIPPAPQPPAQPPTWQLWIECASLTSAAALTAFFAARHMMDSWAI